MIFVAVCVCLVIYLVCSAWFLVSIIFQLHLLIKSSLKTKEDHEKTNSNLPLVTVQVPVFNEKHVIGNLLQSLGNINYPRNCLEVQVLDDSTDETSAIIDREVLLLQQKGVHASIHRRPARDGYKAGALQEGLQSCSGEFILILDADFIPGPDLLLKMVKHFDDPEVGAVQARWAHNNAALNLLTRIQVFLLDSHFTIEQQGRSTAGYLVNFNGTAGMWRRTCIEDAGGWKTDILTEDLELSYRAQLKGWRLKYDNRIVVPADLPEHVTAFKTQQFRWAKGMAQTLAIHARDVVKKISSGKKLHALFHLSGSLTFPAVMGTCLMALPILAGRHYFSTFREISYVILLTGIILPLMCLYYYYGTLRTFSRLTFWTYLPAFVVIYMALCVQNTIAVGEAFLKRKTAFIRTPKLRNTNGRNEYIERRWTFLNSIELLMSCYMAAGLILSIYWGDYFLFLFFAMMFCGLLILLSPSLSHHSKH